MVDSWSSSGNVIEVEDLNDGGVFGDQDDIVVFDEKDIKEVMVDDDSDEAEELESSKISDFLGGGSGTVTDETDDKETIDTKKFIG